MDQSLTMLLDTLRAHGLREARLHPLQGRAGAKPLGRAAKAPLRRGWQRPRKEAEGNLFEQLWQRHRDEGRLWGAVPADLGLLVLDIDGPGHGRGQTPEEHRQQVQEITHRLRTQLEEAVLEEQETPSGGRHLLVACPEEASEIPAKGALHMHVDTQRQQVGEIIHSSGYAAIYDPAAWASATDDAAQGARTEHTLAVQGVIRTLTRSSPSDAPLPRQHTRPLSAAYSHVLGRPTLEQDDTWRWGCPWCGLGESRTRFAAWLADGHYHCFRCREHGTIQRWAQARRTARDTPEGEHRFPYPRVQGAPHAGDWATARGWGFHLPKQAPTAKRPAWALPEEALADKLADEWLNGEVRAANRGPAGGLTWWAFREKEGWRADTALAASRIKRARNDYLASLPEGEALERYRAKLKTSAQRRALQESVALDVLVRRRAWDAEPETIGCYGADGAVVVNLRTGRIRPMTPRDLILRTVETVPRAEPTPVFDRYLRDATGGDDALARWLWRLFGSFLVGDNRLQQCTVLIGGTATGKSVLTDVLCGILGPRVCLRLDTDVLATKGRDAAHDAKVAALEGKRLAVASEFGNGTTWRAPVIKSMTGDRTYPIRPLYEGPREVLVTWSLLLATNEPPRFDRTDGALRRRLVVVPVDHPVPQQRVDRELARKIITQEAPGLLHRMIGEARSFLRDSSELLSRSAWPQALRDRTAALFAETNADAVADYFTSQTPYGEQWDPAAAELPAIGFVDWKTWCVEWLRAEKRGPEAKRIEGMGGRAWAARVRRAAPNVRSRMVRRRLCTLGLTRRPPRGRVSS